MTEKRFTRKAYAIYEKGNPICMTLRDVDKRLNELWEENEQLKQELTPIQYFADKHGINIFNIDEAFHNCWKDNGKLVTENQELRKSSQDYEDVVNNFFLEHENDFNQELKDEITLLFDIEW